MMLTSPLFYRAVSIYMETEMKSSRISRKWLFFVITHILRIIGPGDPTQSDEIRIEVGSLSIRVWSIWDYATLTILFRKRGFIDKRLPNRLISFIQRFISWIEEWVRPEYFDDPMGTHGLNP